MWARAEPFAALPHLDHTPQGWGSWGSLALAAQGWWLQGTLARLARARRHCWLPPGVSHPLGSSARGHASACQGHAVIRWAQGLPGQDSLVQCHCKDTRATGSLCVPADVPVGLPPQCPLGMVHGHPSPISGHSDVRTRGDSDSWPALSQARLPLWLGPCLCFTLLLCRTGSFPPHGQLSEGAPHPGGPAGWGPPQGSCLYPVLTHRGGCWGHFLWSRSPRGTSGLHIWRPAVVLPPPPLGPGTWGCGRPGAAGTLLNPRGLDGEGAAGAPDGATLPEPGQAPGDRGRRARLGAGGLPGGGVWRGHFPAQTDGAGLELWLPQGGGWIWHGVRAQQCRDSTNVLGRDGGDPLGHRGCVTGDVLLPSPK